MLYFKRNMNIVLFSQDELTKPLPPRDERTVHIRKVLHKTTGDSFEAGIIDGQAGQAVITADTDEGISFSFTPQSDGKPLYPVTLIVGFPRPIQLKRLFRDVAGLGVSEICLCGTELGEKSYMDSNIVEKGAARSALIDGTAQAKSTHVPSLRLFPSVKACLTALAEESAACCDGGAASTSTSADKSKSAGTSAACCDGSGDIRVMLDNVKPEGSLFACMQTKLAEARCAWIVSHAGDNTEACGAVSADKSATCCDGSRNAVLPHVYASIGSERGWTDNERDQFKRAGFASCSMGSRVLRTETAATVAATIILQSMEVL